jgi:hypothetical protein
VIARADDLVALETALGRVLQDLDTAFDLAGRLIPESSAEEDARRILLSRLGAARDLMAAAVPAEIPAVMRTGPGQPPR